MTRPLLAAVSLTCCLANAVAAAPTAREAIVAYFSDEDRVPLIEGKGRTKSIELCWDECDYYHGTQVIRESDLWDLVFLHQYYFDEGGELDDFRSRHAALARGVLEDHAKGCAVEAERDVVKCVIAKLQKQLRATYWFVRYDEGYRCQVAKRLTDPRYSGKGSCKRLDQR
jgi:hypothetical protein